MGDARPRIVVLGGDFGGLAAIQGLRHTDADVILVDNRNHHLFQPLLYQVATANLDDSEDGGDCWSTLDVNMPPVYSVEIACG